jgi:hypothetical protein
MSDEALSKLLGRMAKDDVLLKEFCAAPAKVLKREGIKVPPEEIPPKIDQAEFSKRLKAAVASGAGRVNLAPFSPTEGFDASKYADVSIAVPILGHVDIGTHTDEEEPQGPESPTDPGGNKPR